MVRVIILLKILRTKTKSVLVKLVMTIITRYLIGFTQFSFIKIKQPIMFHSLPVIDSVVSQERVNTPLAPETYQTT